MKTLLDLNKKSFLFLLLLIFHSFLVQAAPPTTASFNLVVNSVEGSGFTLSFTKGNGESRIIIIRKNAPVSFVPANGGVYTANSIFGNGIQVATGEYVVMNGTGNSLNVSGLTPGSVFHIAIFEYNGSGITSEFLQIPLEGNISTASAPTIAASNVQSLTVTGHSLRIGFTKGNGAGRMVLMKKGSPVDAAPTDLTYYGAGSQIGSGNTVVYNGPSNLFDMFNLTTSTEYHFAIYEFNGAGKPVYQSVSPAIFNIITNPKPTVASSNFVVDGSDGDRLSLRYTLGNGKGRIIIAREGQAVTVLPDDGMVYTANLSFSAGQHLGDGQYVIYNGSNANESGSNSMTVTSLARNAGYHFAIFEYDLNSNGLPVYLTGSHAATSGITYDEPTVQATNLLIQNVTDKDAQVIYTPGNGTGRILIGRKGAPVNTTPADLANYFASINFGSGTVINADNYVISNSASNSPVWRLQSSTEYHFAVFEYNGLYGILYKDTNPARGHLVTAVRPSIAATSMAYNNIEGNSMKISWYNGNGKGRIIVARKGSPVSLTSGTTGDIKDNITYTPDSVFGQGEQIRPGEFVVYNDSVGTVGTNNSVTLTGLEPNTQYYFAVYEYGQLNGVLQYATASPPVASSLLTGNSFTARPPVTAAHSFSFSGVANRAMNISWINGSGEMRIVVAKAGSPVDAIPADLFSYSANASFGSGSEIGNGNFVVYKGNGVSVNLTELQPAITYHFAVYEANGNKAPVFQNTTVTPALTGSKTTLERPTIAASNISFSSLSATGFTVNWTKGNGGRSLVIIREGSAVNVKPVDGVVYTSHSAFGSGADISTDGSKQYIAYNGASNSAVITGLQPASTYYVTIFEYEETLSVGTAYLTTSFASSFKQIIAAPLEQTSDLQVISSSNGVAQLRWTNGSGQKRIIIAKEGGEVNVVPADNSSYNANTIFGSGQQVGAGNFVVFNGTATTVSVSNLKRNTEYHFAVFEYNQFGSTVLYRAADPARITTVQISTLPVTWLSFNAVSMQNEVLLEWKTATEEKNKLFEVERSVDGFNFHKIGSVLAEVAIQGIHNYHFADRKPEARNAHYRIKQVDVDGNFSYSKTEQVKREETSDVQLLQNPVGSQLPLKCSNNMLSGNITIADAGGRIVYRGTVTNNMMTIDVDHLSSGIYYLKATSKDGSKIISLPFLHQ